MIPFLERLTGKAYGYRSFPDIVPMLEYEKLEEMLANPDVCQVHWWMSPIPKSQVAQIMNNLASQDQFLVLHAPYVPGTESLMAERNCVVFFVIRDPRDFVVSLLHHLTSYNNSMYEQEWYEADRDKQISDIITGTSWHNSVHTMAHRFLAWRHSPVCCVLRFEKLIGPSGGACSFEEHLAELRKIKRALNLDTSDGELLEIFNDVYGTGATYRRAVVGTWKEYFNDYHKEVFKQALGDVLIGLGYERDYNW